MSDSTTEATSETVEATSERTAEAAGESTAAVDPDKNRANLRRVGAIHFVTVMGALTLWGAADSWATTSGWGLAWAAAISNAVIAGFVISSTLHEWGHYAGARLSGSVAPVSKMPVRYFFMFNFPFEQNDKRQFLWMSLGGILAPWVLVLLTVLLVPLDNASRAMLLAAFVTRAVQVSLFEVPVVNRTYGGGDPLAELKQQLAAGFTTNRYAGLAVGAGVWLAI
ncbi:MAG: hypothetical protein JRG76_09085 [Deltaproteobacteria bacterium]|nr:hypothetical protein [Deltaproteobacteria bacterium]MBW2414646.1 hypothetical protein [Deltaproteobacteria bacterium]